jgi:RNA polymerase sigma-70 factor (ECF subfamily)
MTADALVIDAPPEPDPLLQTIRAARAGDDTAFEELMVLTERRVAQISWAILGDAEDVKDAVQETFLRLFRFLGRYDESKDFHGWLARITVNVCRDALRRRKHRCDPLESAPEPASSEARADDELIHRADLAMLRRAVDTLPPKERLAVILRDVEGMRTEDVANALGSTVTTVRVQISRARAKLRSWIARQS